MSDAWTVITLTIDHTRQHTQKELADLNDEVREVIFSYADWSGEHDDGEFLAQDVLDATVVTASIGSRFEIDGAEAAAEAVSSLWPLGTVTLLQERTGDGDPSQSTTTYRRGEKATTVALAPVVDPAPVPHGHDVATEHHADLGGAYVLVEIPADEGGGTLAAAEITAVRARELAGELLRAANASEFHYVRLEKEHADAARPEA